MTQAEFFECDTETVWAKLQGWVEPRQLKIGSRVTLTEFATYVATGRAMMPSEWSDWLGWIDRQAYAVQRILWLQELGDEQYEEYARSKKPTLEPGELEALQKAVSHWREWNSWFAKAVADVVDRVLDDARAGNDTIFGRAPSGQVGPLGGDVLHLPIRFDAKANSFLFDERRAKRLRSSFTAADVPGWTDISVVITGVQESDRSGANIAWLGPHRTDGQE
jgi:hypothetical protein